MFRKALVAYIFLVSLFMLIAISCNITGDDCGPFDDTFKTIDFQTDLKSVSISDDPFLDVQYSPLGSDTTAFDTFSITMIPVAESYSLNTGSLKSSSLLPSAFACSPPIPVSEETITNLEIFSNKNFNSEYASGDNLAELFEVIFLYRNSGYQRMDLNDFITSEANVPDEIFLLLRSAPDTTEPIQFTIEYSQNGIDMDSYEITTKSIVITN
jgi:hypothetical protein